MFSNNINTIYIIKVCACADFTPSRPLRTLFHRRNQHFRFIYLDHPESDKQQQHDDDDVTKEGMCLFISSLSLMFCVWTEKDEKRRESMLFLSLVQS